MQQENIMRAIPPQFPDEAKTLFYYTLMVDPQQRWSAAQVVSYLTRFFESKITIEYHFYCN